MPTQMVTLEQLSQFANAVYLSGGTIPSGWTVLRTAFNQTDGFWAEAWVNSTTHEVVIAYRGTVPSVFQTLWQDAYIATGVEAPGAKDAANFASLVAATVAQTLPGYSLAITGHSLGGYEAQAALAAVDNASAYSSLAPYAVTRSRRCTRKHPSSLLKARRRPEPSLESISWELNIRQSAHCFASRMRSYGLIPPRPAR